MRRIFTSSSPGSKIFYLFLFVLVGLLVAGALLALIAGAFKPDDQAVWFIYINTVFQALFMFLLPAYLVIGGSGLHPNRFLKLQKTDGMIDAFVFGILAFVVSYVFVAFLTQWNKAIALPESMHTVEQWMRDMEDSAMQMTDKFLSGKTVGSLIANLLTMGVLAAISEEVFFRGALQQFLREMTRNDQVAVWISALIFSVMHLQFYGFFPRLILGVLLGYLFLYTQNLWIPILMHFLNNAFIIIVTYLGADSSLMERMDGIPVTAPFAIAALVSGILTVLLFRLYKKRYPQAVN